MASVFVYEMINAASLNPLHFRRGLPDQAATIFGRIDEPNKHPGQHM